nr:hypothetical protein CFP56_41511 [Quercus suber]
MGYLVKYTLVSAGQLGSMELMAWFTGWPTIANHALLNTRLTAPQHLHEMAPRRGGRAKPVTDDSSLAATLRRCRESGWIDPPDTSNLQTNAPEPQFRLKSLPTEIRSMIYRAALLPHAPDESDDRPIAVDRHHNWWAKGDFTTNLIKNLAERDGCSCKWSQSRHRCHAYAIIQLDHSTRTEARLVFVQIIGERIVLELRCENVAELLRSAAFVQRASDALLMSLSHIKFRVACEFDWVQGRIDVWPGDLETPAWYEWYDELTDHAWEVAYDQLEHITALLSTKKVDSHHKRVMGRVCVVEILSIIAYDRGVALLPEKLLSNKRLVYSLK